MCNILVSIQIRDISCFYTETISDANHKTEGKEN